MQCNSEHYECPVFGCPVFRWFYCICILFQAKKQKISENRKHLANVRVVQRNLVFVVGLSPRLADQEVLKKAEYFGKFGRIHKVVINHSTSYAGNQSQVRTTKIHFTKKKYSRGSKTESIRKPNVLKFGFQMVRFSNHHSKTKHHSKWPL